MGASMSKESAIVSWSSADPAAFREMGRRFLQLPIGEVEHVTLAELTAV